MKSKNIENFYLHIGELAITISHRNNVKLIEVAAIKNPNLRAFFTYPDCKLWNTNFNEQDIPFIINKVKSSLKLLKGAH